MVNNNFKQLLPQDLHIHTCFSEKDASVASEQTIALVKEFRYAETMGISDHFEQLSDPEHYIRTVRNHGFHGGTEVSSGEHADDAAAIDFDYYVCHCSHRADYKGIETLLATGKPVIVAHPVFFGADPGKLPDEVYLEINNRYVWRSDWRKFYTPLINRFRFVIGSDAHQPHWLNQNIARQIAGELGIRESLIFNKVFTA